MGLGPKELADLYGWAPKIAPDNCVLVGIRDVDLQEKENIRRAGIEAFTMRDIDERGMRTVMEEALRIAGRGTVGYHVSRGHGLRSTRKMRPAWAHPYPAASPIAKRTWPWKLSPTTAACSASRSSRSTR